MHKQTVTYSGALPSCSCRLGTDAEERVRKRGCQNTDAKKKNPHPFGKRTVVQLAGRYLKRIGYPSNGFNGATHT